jgi:hypothetical protein
MVEIARVLATTLKILAAEVLRLEIREKEIGERYYRDIRREVGYMDVKSKGTYFRLVEQAGLRIDYFNSTNSIVRRRQFSPVRDLFGAANLLHFVCSRPAGSSDDRQLTTITATEVRIQQ